MSNFEQDLLKFINTNDNKISIQQICSIDYSVMLEQMIAYLKKTSCSRDFFDLLYNIYSRAFYISHTMVTETIQQNVQYIIDLSTHSNRTITVIVIIDSSTSDFHLKSNFFLTLCCIKLLKATGIHFNIASLNNLQRNASDLLYVVCDDFAYSGFQLSNHISNIRNAIGNGLLVTNMIGTTTAALAMIGWNVEPNRIFYMNNVERDVILENEDEFVTIKPFEIHQNTFQIVLPPTLIINNTDVGSVLRSLHLDCSTFRKEYDLFMLKALHVDNHYELKAYGQYGNYFKDETLSMIYLCFKYPDETSTLQTMCSIQDLSGKWTLNMSLVRENGINLGRFHVVDSEFKNYEITNSYYDLTALIDQKSIKYLYDNRDSKEISNIHLKDIRGNTVNWIEQCHPVDGTVTGSARKKWYPLIRGDWTSKINRACKNHWMPYYKSIQYDRLDIINRYKT